MTREELIAEISGHVAQFWFPGMQVPTKYKEDLLDIIDYVDIAAAVRFGVSGEDALQGETERVFSLVGGNGTSRKFSIVNIAGAVHDMGIVMENDANARYITIATGNSESYTNPSGENTYIQMGSEANGDNWMQMGCNHSSTYGVGAYFYADQSGYFELGTGGIYGNAPSFAGYEPDGAAYIAGAELQINSSRIVIPNALQNFADDAAAAIGGIAVNRLYRTGSAIKTRVA